MANGLWSNGIMVQAALDGARMGSAPDSSKFSAFTQIYRCRDDRWFVLTILPQAQEQAWPRLAACLGHPDWVEDERFNTADSREQNKRELTDLLREAIGREDWAHWHSTFADHGITCGAIAKTADHGLDAQVEAAGALAEFDGGAGRTVSSPLFVEGLTKRTPAAAPEVGEHTSAILKELELDG
jgi:crotonobetainyl-CoA:carnitine CoA-transferase CaiB-like acyl-CoA transferase